MACDSRGLARETGDYQVTVNEIIRSPRCVYQVTMVAMLSPLAMSLCVIMMTQHAVLHVDMGSVPCQCVRRIIVYTYMAIDSCVLV